MNVGQSVVYPKGVVTVLLIAAAQAGDVLSPWGAGPTKDYSKNRRVSIGGTMSIEWKFTKGNGRCELQLWQDNFPGDRLGGPWRTLDNTIRGSTYTWTVTYAGLDPKFQNVYYLQITNGEDTATTHYFNITGDEASTTSPTSTTATTSPGVSSTLGPNSPSTQATATVWQTATAVPSTGESSLSTGSLVGMIVGVVAALVALLTGMWWSFRIWKRRRSRGGDTASPSDPHPAVGGGNSSTGADDKNDKKTYSAEMGGVPVSEAEAAYHVRPVYEVDGTQIQRDRV